MKIKLTSVYVDDQDKALRFYTEVLGFAKKTDVIFRSYEAIVVITDLASESARFGSM